MGEHIGGKNVHITQKNNCKAGILEQDQYEQLKKIGLDLNEFVNKKYMTRHWFPSSSETKAAQTFT